jgi:shikimate kinase
VAVLCCGKKIVHISKIADIARPLLQVADPLERIRDLFDARDPLYQEIAHFVMETGRPSVATLVNMIVMQLELAGVVPST